jgi:ornithine carbamoyltransferase
MKKRDLLTLLDLKDTEIKALVKSSKEIKKGKKASLKNKILISLFDSPSTRTRLSSTIAMMQMGGQVVNLDFGTSQINRGESLADTAKVLGLYGDVVLARILDHQDMETLAENSSVPVINGLTKKFHPTQTIGDLLTVEESCRKIKGLKVVYIGDCGSNTAHSTMIGFSKLGAEVTLICPPIPLYKPDRIVFNKAIEGKKKVQVVHDLKAVKDADIIYTDVWVSMGFEKQYEQRLRSLGPYQVNSELLKLAPNAKIMHYLPAHRGMEITEEVFNSKNSLVWKQAENRLHSFKAIFKWLVK